MSSGFVDPNATVSNSGPWLLQTASGSLFTKIDDGVRQPTAPSIVGDYIYVDGNTLNNIATVDCTTIANVASVSQIKVWTYAIMDHTGGLVANGNLYVDILVNNVAVGEQLILSCAAGNDTGAQAWYSATFNGSWTQADLDSLRLRVHLQITDPSDAGQLADIVYEMYGEITYTDAPTAAPVGRREGMNRRMSRLARI